MLPKRLSFPTRVGLSVKDYYKLVTPVGLTHDETYGFAEAGITAGMPVTFIPHDFGMVILTTGVDFLFLDHNMTLVNRGNGDAVIGRMGLTWVFDVDRVPRCHNRRRWNPPSTSITCPVEYGSAPAAIATTAFLATSSGCPTGGIGSRSPFQDSACRISPSPRRSCPWR